MTCGSNTSGNLYQTSLTNDCVIKANSTGVLTSIATANDAVLATNGSGVPSMTATPTLTSVTFGTGTPLSGYIEGTWIPVLSFGGASTGITYAIQSANYRLIGRFIYSDFVIVLSSKGSSTGNAVISGLPFASANNLTQNVLVVSNLTFTAGYTTCVCSVTTGATLNLDQIGSAQAITSLTDTNFANNSTVNGVIVYGNS